MVNPSSSPEIAVILQLLTDYSFDTAQGQTEAIVAGWLQQFAPSWVNQAITEALYQGRYKVVSVEHILQFWQRRGQPLRHFNREFEAIILGQTLLYPPPYGETNSSAKPESVPGPGAPTRPQPVTAQPVDLKLDNDQTVLLSQAKKTVDEPSQGTTQSGSVPNFRPIALDFSGTWVSVETIQPFVPSPETSELHQRLKAVVQAGQDNS